MKAVQVTRAGDPFELVERDIPEPGQVCMRGSSLPLGAAIARPGEGV